MLVSYDDMNENSKPGMYRALQLLRNRAQKEQIYDRRARGNGPIDHW